MKKLCLGAFIGLLAFGSCAQKKENREEFKEDHNKDYMRNNMGETAAEHSEMRSDTAQIKSDTTTTR